MLKKIAILLVLFFVVYGIYYITKDQPRDTLSALKEKYSKDHQPSVDHTKLSELQKDFKSPHEVTAACISCHNKRDHEVMQTSHWNWVRESYVEGRGIIKVGKKNLINNFCIGIAGSEGLCNTCHAGYGWVDSTFDFSEPTNIDCLACHSNTGTYSKKNGTGGMPDPSVDLTYESQNVGLPQKENCGHCHFLSGGGNNVKHGDLEMALLNTTREVDVHMGKDALDMACVDCHEAENHRMLGKMYTVSSMDRDRMECEQCHSTQPHTNSTINEHSNKVACQTCHIPIYAKVNATKMFWDWSKACKTMDPDYYEVDSVGNHVYLAKKGRFVWQKNVKPEYVFFNGTADHYLMGDKIDTSKQPININTLNGSYADRNSKIIPVKIHRTIQAYDPVTNLIIQPKLWDKEEGNGALWVDCKHIDIKDMWGIASQKGMEYVGLPYSGQYAFVNTRMFWPVNHMVSPKDQALKCEDCHTRNDGRLHNLDGFYMPGRDFNPTVQYAGISIIILSIIGVAIHGGARILISTRKKKGDK
jgi:octaheme c-type cytochrome (tetrathionate reductase family)